MDGAAYYELLDRTSQETLAVARRFPEKILHESVGGAWSPMQVLEHAALTEALVMGVLQRPSELTHDGETVHGESKLFHLIVNKRAMKLTAPDRLMPTGRYQTIAEFEAAFLGQRQALRAALESGAIVCDNRMYPHPALGNMTVEDWLYFLVHHTQRHLEQVKELLPATV